MKSLIYCACSFSVLFAPLAASAQLTTNMSAHDGKKILHASDSKEQTFKVCNEDPAKPKANVYIGERAQLKHVKFGECKEFKAKVISVDKDDKNKDT